MSKKTVVPNAAFTGGLFFYSCGCECRLNEICNTWDCKRCVPSVEEKLQRVTSQVVELRINWNGLDVINEHEEL
jgi:hypothetical protein